MVLVALMDGDLVLPCIYCRPSQKLNKSEAQILSFETYTWPPSFVAVADPSCASEFPTAAMAIPDCNSNATAGALTINYVMYASTDRLNEDPKLVKALVMFYFGNTPV